MFIILAPRQCSVCGKLAEFECRECFGNLQAGTGLDCTAFCQACLKTVHIHPKRYILLRILRQQYSIYLSCLQNQSCFKADICSKGFQNNCRSHDFT